jgi:hypothetical protein
VTLRSQVGDFQALSEQANDRPQIYSDLIDPPPSSAEPKNGAHAPGGGGDFFRELRRRKVGQTKAREIADRYPDQSDRILTLIDTRPDASDPNSLGRLIIDILDGVLDAAPVRAGNGAPLMATRPNLPERPLPAAELARRLRGRRDPS